MLEKYINNIKLITIFFCMPFFSHALVHPMKIKAKVKGLESNQKIQGEVLIERLKRREVQVTANVTGLSPNQKFGFHVHENGSCENKGLAAGSHLSLGRLKKHGSPFSKKNNRHTGDLGNLSSNSKGKASYKITIHGKPLFFLGRAIIIHSKEDDLKSQPTGNAGARIACGILGVEVIKK